MQKIRIVVIYGPEAGREFLLTGDKITVGRSPQCDYRLAKDDRISGRHAVLEWQDDQWCVRDLKSTNGTWIESGGEWRRAAASERLCNGHKLMLGSTVVQVKIDGESQLSPLVEKTPDTLEGLILPVSAQREVLRVDLSGETLKYQLLTSNAYGTQYTAQWCQDDSRHVTTRMEGLVRSVNHMRKDSARGDDTHIVKDLESIGLFLRKHLIPKKILDKLDKTTSAELFISHPPALVNLPWELLYIKEKPICLGFSVGRQVLLEDYSYVIAPQRKKSPHMLIVANPTEDLEAGQEEAELLFHTMRQENPEISIDFLSGARVERIDVLTRLEQTDILYYVGHAFHDPVHPSDSGWLLSGGCITASDFRRLDHPPRFVFANGCETGKEAQWGHEDAYNSGVYGIASSFILAGVTNFIGSMWPIATESSAFFAQNVFQGLVRHLSVGEALRQARLQLIHRYGQAEIVWASYVLFGDPGNRIFENKKV